MTSLSRRSFLAGALLAPSIRTGSTYKLAPFTVDVTPPLGEPLLAGLYEPAHKIDDPLYVKGLVLVGPEKPIVIVAVDFCEIRTTSYQRWRNVIASAVNSTPDRVLVTSLHQHEAPLADVEGQRILEEYQISTGKICSPAYHEDCIQKTSTAVRTAMHQVRTVTHLGFGEGKVDRVSSNRRAELPDGTITFQRSSTTTNADVRNAPEGLIDPHLKTLSFWNHDQAIAALSCYSVHAQTHFRTGRVTGDFTALARSLRQQQTPNTFQMYAAGCSGDTTVGKFNDGDPRNIPILAERVRKGMEEAWKNTQKRPLDKLNLRSVPLPLRTRNDAGFSEADEKSLLADKSKAFKQHALAAMGSGWRRLKAKGYQLELPVVDFGPALLVLAPGECFVQYQLWAQEMRPDAFVMVMGYGECAPGYVPTTKAVAEGWKDETWSWAEPSSCEEIMLKALRSLLEKKA